MGRTDAERLLANREAIRNRRLDPDYRARERQHGLEYRKANKKKLLEKYAKYNREHKDELREKRLLKYRSNPEQGRAISERWRKANPEAVFATHLRSKYGIEAAEWETIIKACGGRCMICDGAKKLRVDHSHENGLVRGALCHQCNLGLGMFGDSAELLIRAVAYLERSSVVKAVSA